MKARQMILARKSAYRPVSDWTLLQVGEAVELLRHARVVACGRVEEVSVSGTVLWIAGGAAVGERNFVKSDGVFVRRT